MGPGRLGALQVRILRTLAAQTPRFTLSGGAALVGVHTKHRTTRDLGTGSLGMAGEEASGLSAFCDELAHRVLALAVPD